MIVPFLLAAVGFAAPAGDLPAGRTSSTSTDTVLPSGRIVAPIGTILPLGGAALGMTLTPDGRFAIAGGDALTVADATTLQIVDRYVPPPGEHYWAGIAAVADPVDPARTLVLASGGASDAVYVFTVDGDGRIAAGRTHAIRLGRGSTPGTIVVAPGGRRAYVVENGGDDVEAIDLAARAAVGLPQPVGDAPFAAALAGARLLVADEGLERASALPVPAGVPPFRPPYRDEAHASALSLLGLDAAGNWDGLPADGLAMDRPPDGIRYDGGAHPDAIAVTPRGAYAFVAMANVDRIATVALGAQPRVVSGSELRLFDRGPYGTQPSALALSRDGTRLYVALAGLDAVAVIDAHEPLHLRRLGLIPTGATPVSLALGPDDRTLYVVNADGNGSGGATLQRIELGTVRLRDATLAALHDVRRVVSATPHYPAAIRNVVMIVERDRTFDAALGTLGAPWGDPSLDADPAPNLVALASRYAVAANLFAEGADPAQGDAFLTAGMTTVFALRTPGGPDDDPDDRTRMGTIFDAAARAKISYRDYGLGFDLSGRVADPSAVPGLGATFTLDVPADPALADHVDLRYPGPDAAISDGVRAAEFVRDYGALARAGRAPRFAAVALPGDGDAALGRIVAVLSSLPTWRHTAIVITASDPGHAGDHVDPSRTFAVVVSPYAKRGYVGTAHLSSASVLKTAEELLHLPPVSLGDLLATDMASFFTPNADLAPYEEPAAAAVQRTP